MDTLGLIDCVVMLAIAVLWWGLYNKTARPPPGDKRDPANYAAMTGLALLGGVLPADAPAPKTLSLPQALDRIQRTGGYEDAEAFLADAKRAYELIVGAFARGELDRVAQLVTPEVRRDFERFIAMRRERGESETLTFVGFRGADIFDAGYDFDRAWIDVRFATSMVSVTRDAEGRIVAGHPARLDDCAEIWTFERLTTRKGAPWLLSATDSDE